MEENYDKLLKETIKEKEKTEISIHYI